MLFDEINDHSKIFSQMIKEESVTQSSPVEDSISASLLSKQIHKILLLNVLHI